VDAVDAFTLGAFTIAIPLGLVRNFAVTGAVEAEATSLAQTLVAELAGPC